MEIDLSCLNERGEVFPIAGLLMLLVLQEKIVVIDGVCQSKCELLYEVICFAYVTRTYLHLLLVTRGS